MAELDVLLTAGRLAAPTRAAVDVAYEEGGVPAALTALVLTPEFHTLGPVRCGRFSTRSVNLFENPEAH